MALNLLNGNLFPIGAQESLNLNIKIHLAHIELYTLQNSDMQFTYSILFRKKTQQTAKPDVEIIKARYKEIALLEEQYEQD